MSEKKDKCPKCKGRGEVIFSYPRPNSPDSFNRLPCPTCNGTGEKKLDSPKSMEEIVKQVENFTWEELIPLRNLLRENEPEQKDKLREKILGILGEAHDAPTAYLGYDKGYGVDLEPFADKLIALFPDIEGVECYVQCSHCGAKVSNTVKSPMPEGLVVRAFIECVDCVAKQPTIEEERGRIIAELVKILETIQDNKARALFLAQTRNLRQALKEKSNE